MARADVTPKDDDRPGGSTAFETLFHTYYAPLSEFVYRYVKSREVAHEVVQDLFLRLWELTEAPEVPALSAAYLYRAARNRALKHLRHERVVARWRERTAGQERSSAVTGVEELEGREVTEAVDRAIAELPERCRLVFTLSRQRELTHAEIAELMGISVKTVEAQITKALKTLRRQLAPFLR